MILFQCTHAFSRLVCEQFCLQQMGCLLSFLLRLLLLRPQLNLMGFHPLHHHEHLARFLLRSFLLPLELQILLLALLVHLQDLEYHLCLQELMNRLHHRPCRRRRPFLGLLRLLPYHRFDLELEILRHRLRQRCFLQLLLRNLLPLLRHLHHQMLLQRLLRHLVQMLRPSLLLLPQR